MLIQTIAILFFLSFLKAVDSDRGGGNQRGDSPERGPHRDSQGRPFIPNIRAPALTRDNLCTTAVVNAGIFLPDNHPPDAPFVCSICTDSTTFSTCSITASRCFTRLSVEAKASRRTTFCDCKDGDAEVKTAFSEWVNLSNGGNDPCNETQPMLVGPFGIQPGVYGNQHEGRPGDQHGGIPGGLRGGIPGGQLGGIPGGQLGGIPGGPGSFNPFSTRVDDRYADFTAFMQSFNSSNPSKQASLECCMSQKFGLFENGRANITAWNLKAERKPDGVAENAIKAAITQCASSTALCSVRAFLDCIMSTCFNQLQLIDG